MPDRPDIPITSLEDWTPPDEVGTAYIAGKAMEVTEQIKPLLRGLGPLIQSAVLADLFSMLLAGVQGEGKEEMREAMLDEMVRLVRHLLPTNEKHILEAAFGKEADQ